ncbi:MAG TPA: alpha/beta fold hydrolase [Terriglobales bacterium]|nr:alpha/beta fold hydrolase [Terriglobales bacterium]
MISIRLRLIAAGTCLAFFAGCATTPQTAGGLQYGPAANTLREARSSQVPAEKRAADYLQVAAMTAPLLGTGAQEGPARDTYNAACGELTVLLRNSEGGRLWNQPLTLTENNKTYHLRLEPASNAVWAPNYFTTFELEAQVKQKLIKKENLHEGVGGALVGVRILNPPEKFAPPKGITAPVTATLDFHAADATLALRRPTKQPTASVEGKVRPLEADFSAPISYYQPPANLMFVGLFGGFRASSYPGKGGLYFLQPYDPDRIPLVFVHGLFSTPFTWVQTINGLQADPEIRKHYQFWVFAYPTGNPVLYSALRLREELAKVDKLYPNHKNYVLVGHSMGGLLTQAQVTSMSRADWEKTLGAPAMQLFATLKPADLVAKATTFKANPRIKRVVFVCTPHRGSKLATGGIGGLGIKLISLPADLTTTMKSEIPEETLRKMNNGRLPNSVSNLAPKAPYLAVLNKESIQAPYHSIIGNRGKPGPLADSSDGVVPYWSSHLDGAKSECIVPGPHGSCELPQTITELDRILRLHLKTTSSSKPIHPIAQVSP